MDLVLDELETRQPDAVERLVVGAVGVGNRDGRGTHLTARLEPLAEDRPCSLVALEVNPPNLASPVVEIEVPRKLGKFCLGLRGGRFATGCLVLLRRWLQFTTE